MSQIEDKLTRGVTQVGDLLAPRWVAPLFLTMSILLVPWIVYLGISLPARSVANHYRTAWVGFDVLLLYAMSRTAWLALKEKPQMELPAIVTATLLIVDAWFDVTTAGKGWPQVEALVLALFVELPTAVLAIYISRRVQRLSTANPSQPPAAGAE